MSSIINNGEKNGSIEEKNLLIDQRSVMETHTI